MGIDDASDITENNFNFAWLNSYPKSSGLSINCFQHISKVQPLCQAKIWSGPKPGHGQILSKEDVRV